MLTGRDLYNKYVDFFVSKGHVEIPSASLIPENDPTTLFISAGMHPLVPYLLGKTHQDGKRVVDVQKCVRTGDIDDVGDTTHHTFFEMLGNWSFGDYFKDDQIAWSFEFLTKHLGYKVEDIYITCFEGDDNSPKDEYSASLWIAQGIDKTHINFLGKEDNWWGPAGLTGPCGPDSEMFVDTDPTLPKVSFQEGQNAKRYVEVWNDVFMQYNKTADGKFVVLQQKNVDTGMGVERNTAILNGFDDNYRSPVWWPIIENIQNLSQKPYETNEASMRIVADHVRATVFIATDGIIPSNKEAGYVLRRLIRRAVRQCLLLNISSLEPIVGSIYDNQNNFAGTYPELDQQKQKVIEIILGEEKKFKNTIQNGLKEIEKLIAKKQIVSGEDAFKLYESFGFPVELVVEELKKHNLTLDLDAFNLKKQSHQDASRTLSAGKFKSGLADNTFLLTRYHTATHLLHTALRQVLGSDTHQDGSNNTAERLRFDFTYSGGKLTDEQVLEIENLVNQKIKENLPVSIETMPFTEAQSNGALAFFKTRYPEVVSVYTIGDFSKEVCTGPHVNSTSEVGEFKITKQESVSSGVRRIYASIN